MLEKEIFFKIEIEYLDRDCGCNSGAIKVVSDDDEVYKKGGRCVYSVIYGCGCCGAGCKY